MIVIRKDLCELLGLSARGLKDMLSEPDAPEPLNTPAPGRPLEYEAATVVQFYCDRKIRQVTGDSTRTFDLSQERAKLAEKQREKLELDMELKRGQYLDYADTLSGLQSVFIAMKNKLLALPVKAVAQLKGITDTNQQADVLEGIIHDALSELSTGAFLDEPPLGAAKPPPVAGSEVQH